MIGLDTNVWARAILDDDLKQSRAARTTIQRAASGTGIFVPLLVFVELGWVLGGAPGWNASRVHHALERLLNTAGVEVEAASILREALARRTGSVGLADNLIALVSQNRGCSQLLTFDTRFARSGKAVLLKA
jgi:predicted nucleic-acid-binding protein